MVVSSEEATVVAGGDNTLARHTDAARLADDITRHVVGVSRHILTAYLHQQQHCQ